MSQASTPSGHSLLCSLSFPGPAPETLSGKDEFLRRLLLPSSQPLPYLLQAGQGSPGLGTHPPSRPSQSCGPSAGQQPGWTHPSVGVEGQAPGFLAVAFCRRRQGQAPSLPRLPGCLMRSTMVGGAEGRGLLGDPSCRKGLSGAPPATPRLEFSVGSRWPGQNPVPLWQLSLLLSADP